ncbi:MAG: hypothetical protein CM1200mP2_23420 [Planctomycetaceae bacterium]|nr:MAG: hypothetical protein CM1200mP2_23420 [Planctomycetaceae bacterium]
MLANRGNQSLREPVLIEPTSGDGHKDTLVDRLDVQTVVTAPREQNLATGGLRPGTLSPRPREPTSPDRAATRECSRGGDPRLVLCRGGCRLTTVLRSTVTGSGFVGVSGVASGHHRQIARGPPQQNPHPRALSAVHHHAPAGSSSRRVDCNTTTAMPTTRSRVSPPGLPSTHCSDWPDLLTSHEDRRWWNESRTDWTGAKR